MTSDAIPDFMESVVTPPPPRRSAAEVATERDLVLDTAMMGIYEDALAKFEANIRANCPIILGLFGGRGAVPSLARGDRGRAGALARLRREHAPGAGRGGPGPVADDGHVRLGRASRGAA